MLTRIENLSIETSQIEEYLIMVPLGVKCWLLANLAIPKIISFSLHR